MTEDKNKATIKKLEHSEIEISGEISFEELNQYREKAIERLGEEVSIDGFRKGHIPEDVLVKKIGEMNVLYEMAEMALKAFYPQIILGEHLNVLGQPEIFITKIAPNNPLEFKIKTAVIPSFVLPNYKKIAGKAMSVEENIEATEKEVEDSIKQLKKQVAQQEMINREEALSEIKDEDLPELTEEFIKKFGDFENVEDFKTKIKENILSEKRHRAKDKKRMETIEEIIKETDIDLPKILVENELEKMMGQFKDDISRMGLNFEKYLEHIKKTERDMRKEWGTDAEQRVKMQLILNEIAKEEDIKAPQKELEENVARILEQYKEAKEENARIYSETILTNEEVFKFLEEQK